MTSLFDTYGVACRIHFRTSSGEFPRWSPKGVLASPANGMRRSLPEKRKLEKRMLTGHRLSASNRYSAVEPADLTESNGEGHPQCPPPTVPRELKASAGHLFAVLSGRLHQEGRPPKKEASLLLRRSPGSDRPDWGHLARTGKLSGVRGLGARLWKTGAVQQLLWQKLVFGADEWGEAGRLSPCGPVDSLWSSGPRVTLRNPASQDGRACRMAFRVRERGLKSRRFRLFDLGIVFRRQVET